MDEISTPVSVDEEIYRYLNLDKPRSFFLFAGAGSGKTRSLVEALKRFRENNIGRLKRNSQRVAIITYTNAACDEIKSRLDFDSTFNVSTIHSFSWELINSYTYDIRSWVKASLDDEINDLNEKQRKAKNHNTKTYIDRARKIESKSKRLSCLKDIKKFIYKPNGDNTTRDSLNHTEVIKIAADFIQNKPLMQKILVRKYPILLIDESQDTKKELVDAFFEVQNNQSTIFTLGMFGDTMQRIYTDGKKDLGSNIPVAWAKPAKEINYRCPKRVVALINKIRAEADGQVQKTNKDSDGVVRLFIVDSTNLNDKLKVELSVASQMAVITRDQNWNNAQADIKILTLEHHMAARRGGFSMFFDPLYEVDKLKTSLLDGTLAGITLFAKQIFPLVRANQAGEKFEVSKIVRKNSPILKKENLKACVNPIAEIGRANNATKKLFSLWEGRTEPTMSDILKEVFRSGLFQIPEVLIPIAKRLNDNQEQLLHEELEDDVEKDKVIEAWDKALQCRFDQFKEYVYYISDESRFGTHQGIKGLQFPRVMVILDDDESRGFLFSYEKLFGVKKLSKNDISNQREGKETSVDRTRRLFYVTCSRAEESLAIVAFTKDSQKAREFVLAQDWFSENEIIQIDNLDQN